MSTVTPTSPAVPTTISNLAPIPQPIGNSDVVAVVQNGTTYKATAVQLAFPNNIVLPVSQGGTGNSTGNLSALNATATGATTSRTLAAYFSDVINVLDFGAVGNGVADDTVAIKAAIAAANARGGALVCFPNPSYVFNPSSIVSVGTGVTLLGNNRYGTKIISQDTTAQLFYLTGLGSAIRRMGIVSSVTNTSGQFVQLAGEGNVLDDVYFSGDYTAINITGVESVVNNLEFDAAASGADRIIVNCGDASPKISTIIMNAQSAPYASSAIKLLNVVALTMSDIDCLNQGNGLEIIPGSGQGVSSVFGTNLRFDSGTYGMFCQPSSTGGVANMQFVNFWGGNASNTGVIANCSGSGTVKGLNFTNLQVPNSAGAGASFDGNCTDININGGLAGNCASDGVYFGNAGNVSINNFNSGAYDNFAGNTGWGIDFATTSLTAITCTNNNVIGNTGGAIRNVATTAGQFISNNQGYNPVGYLSSQPAVPSTTVNYQNLFGVRCRVFVTGGTVTAISINGTATGLTAGTFEVENGDNISWTGSGAPTWKWFGI